MDKLDKLGVSNAPLPRKQTAPVYAEDYNKVIDVLNNLVAGKFEVIEVSGNANTLRLSDFSSYLRITNATLSVVTIPKSNEEELPISTSVVLEQSGVGSVKVIGETGVTILGNPFSPEQYSILKVIKVKDNQWVCLGGVEDEPA